MCIGLKKWYHGRDAASVAVGMVYSLTRFCIVAAALAMAGVLLITLTPNR